MMPDRQAPCYRSNGTLERLWQIYTSTLRAEVVTGPPAVLARTLGELCARGRAGHADLDLDEGAFVAHLARCGASVADDPSALHVQDLYLAAACLAGNEVAVARLRELGRSVIVSYLRRISNVGTILEDVEQRLWEAVLVGTPEGPKLAKYSGRGPLGSWIGVSAQRIALMVLRRERAEARARHEVAAQETAAQNDPEMETIKLRYRNQFQMAVGAAVTVLNDREKTIYRMHLVDGVTLEGIGKIYGVHHSTVLRWLSTARKRVVDEAKRQLRNELAMSSNEFESIARLLMSAVDLDISSVLGKPD